MEIVLSALPTASLLGGLALCVILAWHDLRHLILPDKLNTALMGMALVYHLSTNWIDLRPWEAALGAAVGSLSLYVVSSVYSLVRKKQGLGLGDVKFMLAAGVWVGVWELPALILIASLTTLGTIIFLKLAGHLRAGTLSNHHFPFGPGLAVSLALLILKSSGYWLW